MLKVFRSSISRRTLVAPVRTLSSSDVITVELGENAFMGHSKRHMQILNNLLTILTECDTPSTTTSTSKDELLKFFKMMYTMRRMEITNDTEYKVYMCGLKLYDLTGAHAG